MTVFPNGATSAPTVSSPFGPRKGGAFGVHYGVDFINMPGDIARSIAAGTVTFAGWANSAAGNTVIVYHGDGIESLYMHLERVTVSKGAQIAEGQQLGVVGATGNATGKCLHYEVRVHGTSVEPIAWTRARLVVAPAYPLPAGHYFGPRSGPAQSVSGYYSHRGDLRVWQQRMRDRGWGIDADGLYGDQTADVARRFQAEKGLTADGLIGPATWGAAWTAPVT